MEPLSASNPVGLGYLLVNHLMSASQPANLKP